jgi:hypothetical protein
MSDAYVIQVRGWTAGIVTRDAQGYCFSFFSAAPRFNVMEGQHFSDPSAAERAARKLAKHGSLPRRAKKPHFPARRRPFSSVSLAWRLCESNRRCTFD